MRHRIFAAIGIPPPLQEEILDWEKKFEILPVRWLSGKNLHLTLVPPWYETDWTRAAENLWRVRSDPFHLEFTHVDFGPNPREPRLIWAEGHLLEPLAALLTSVYAALNIPPESRLFKPHLTLARFKQENFKTFPIRKLGKRVHWQFEVSSILLMESHLSAEGADYEILQEIPFSSES